jgi:hypothetical protein
MRAFIFLLCWLPIFGVMGAQPNYTDILQSIRQGNMQTLVSYLDQKVELTIGSTDHVADANKTAELVGDFLKKNPVSTCAIVHSGAANDNSSFYLIGRMVAGGKPYRLYLLLKPKANKHLIQEMRFEAM